MICFPLESLPDTVVKMVFLHLLNLPDYAKLDTAIVNIRTKQLLAEQISNAGSSTWFPICFDIIKPEQNKKMTQWFSEKRIIKHQNIELYNMKFRVSTKTTIVDSLEGLDIDSIIAVSLHGCLPGDNHTLQRGFGLASNLKLLPSLIALNFVKCTCMTDECIRSYRKHFQNVFSKPYSSRNNIAPGQPSQIEVSLHLIHSEDDKGEPVYILYCTIDENNYGLVEFIESNFEGGLKFLHGFVSAT
jgi:hypothetical protein